MPDILTRRRPARGAELIRLRHAEARACSWDGTEYAADENGDVWVPAAAAAALSAHGFAPVAEKE